MRMSWLYGAKCTLSVWKETAFDFTHEDCVYVQYPHALTKMVIRLMILRNGSWNSMHNRRLIVL